MKLSSAKFTLTILALLAVLIFLNWFQWLDAPKNVFFKIISAPGKLITEAAKKISSPFYYLIHFRDLAQENEALLFERNRLLGELSELKEIRRENEILREALFTARTERFDLISAKVIGLNFLNFDNVILVDRGERDGIKKDMPVITKDKFLVGKIIEVYPNSSKIIAISSASFNIVGIAQESRARGIVRGINSQNELLMDSIAKDAEINVGDLIVTSGAESIFPRGLLMGKVKKVERQDIDLFQRAYIGPLISLTDLEDVFIIKSW